jgi:hypothetical protein
MFRLLKLKPPHGWNAVAWELAIVTLGVVLALIAQQTAQSTSDRRNADAALMSMREELSYNLAFIKRRLELNRCIARRLDEVASYLDAVEAGQHPAAPRFIGHPPYPEFTRHRLEAALAAGWMSHLAPDDQALVAKAYQPLVELKQYFDNEQVAWAELRSLVDRPRLAPGEIANLRIALQHARMYFFYGDADSKLAERAATALRVEPSKTSYRMSSAMCLPMSTAFEDAARTNDSTFAEVR